MIQNGGPKVRDGRTDSAKAPSEAPFMRNVLGPDGNVLTFDNLPPSETKRWVVHRKAQVVSAVRGGLLSFGDACERYALTPEEFMSWQDAVEHFGLKGLYATRSRRCPH
jgi:hypothetical protein